MRGEGVLEQQRLVFGLHPVLELVKARPRDVSVVYLLQNGGRGPSGGRQSDEQVFQACRDRGVAVEESHATFFERFYRIDLRALRAGP